MKGLLVLNHQVWRSRLPYCWGWAALSTSSDIWLQLALRVLGAPPTTAGNLFLGIVTVLGCFSLMFWTAFPPLHMFEWKQRALSLVLLFPRGRSWEAPGRAWSDLGPGRRLRLPRGHPETMGGWLGLSRWDIGLFKLRHISFCLWSFLLRATAIKNCTTVHDFVCNIFRCYHLGFLWVTFCMVNIFYLHHHPFFLFFPFDALWKMHP